MTQRIKIPIGHRPLSPWPSAMREPPTLSCGSVSVRNVTKRVLEFIVSEDGPTAVEYAVMLALILVACITIVTNLGTTVSGTFSKVNSTLSS
jgi:pilus assembly protein Flp/PilA